MKGVDEGGNGDKDGDDKDDPGEEDAGDAGIKSDEDRKRRREIFCMQHKTGETEENRKTGRGMQNGIFDRVIEDMKKDRSDKYHQTITYLCFWMDWKKMVKMVLVRNSVV